MRRKIGFAVHLLGIALSFYVGFYVMFLCGIQAVGNELTSNDPSMLIVILNLLRVLFAATIGIFIFLLSDWASDKIGHPERYPKESASQE